MPFCSHCGHEYAESDATFCSNCGRSLSAATALAPGGRKGNPAAVAALIIGIVSIFSGEFTLIPVLAIIFGAIGVHKAAALGGRGRRKAWAGLILGIIYFIVSLYQHGRFG